MTNSRPQQRQRALGRIRALCVGTTSGVILLCGQGTLTGDPVFHSFALGLAVAGLAVITLLVSLAVRMDD